ncbi:MAG: hypothetical protein IKO05_09480 [Selenomonadaceae bacterium]|nr:hypothetical protein [Selenomonadaceae bacterium]
MNETLFLVIFVVVFYFVFRTIWRNVTTVSYNGLSGFINSWWSQVLWAVFITTIISMIICGILDAIINFFGEYGGKIVGGLSFVVFWYIIKNLPDESNSDGATSFDKKTFMYNYNNNVSKFGEAANIYNRISNYKSSAEPGDKIAEGIKSELRQGIPLSLTEEFLTNENGVKLINFPNAQVLYSDENNEPHIIFMIDLWEDVNNNGLERIFIDIVLTAAIAAVEPGKSDEIKRELNLINDDEPIFYLPPYNPAEKSSNMFLAVSKATYNFSRFEDFVTFSIYIYK